MVASTSTVTLESRASGLPASPTRPQHKRRVSRESPGWYNTEGGMTLDDFAKRLDTKVSRLQQWQARCAQDIVMALMRPTPVVLFVLNPVSMLVWAAVVLTWRSLSAESLRLVTSG